MEVLVLGGDLRYLEIIDDLSSKYSVDVVGYKNTYINDCVRNININKVDIGKYDVIIFPINGVMDKNLINCRFNNVPIKLSDDFLVGSKDDVLIFSGISTPNLDRILEVSNRNCVYMMKDKEVVSSNAIPTVEGIIADVIVNTDSTIHDTNFLVFGYGNIGQVLVKYLRLLGANVTVSIIEDKDKEILDSVGIDSFYSNNVSDLVKSIGSVDVIINTVPSCVIDNSLIKYINRECYVLDIASHPHGIDREVLDEFFIKNKLYLGIPGKVAPKTSGKILSRKINSVLGD